MGKYVKLFQTTSEATSATVVITPTLSFCKDRNTLLSGKSNVPSNHPVRIILDGSKLKLDNVFILGKSEGGTLGTDRL